MKKSQTPEQFMFYMRTPFAIGTLWRNNVAKTTIIYTGMTSAGGFQFYSLYERRIIELDEMILKYHYECDDIERIL